MNGIKTGRLLRRRQPQLGIVLFSHHLNPHYRSAVPQNEITGWSYLIKSSVGSLSALVRAIEGVAAGQVVLDPGLTARLRSDTAGPLARLTSRQREILSLIAQGFSNAAIAQNLGLSLKTVENQNNLIYQEMAISQEDNSLQPRVQAVLTYLKEIRAI